jgi:hypothetical protein
MSFPASWPQKEPRRDPQHLALVGDMINSLLSRLEIIVPGLQYNQPFVLIHHKSVAALPLVWSNLNMNGPRQCQAW